MRSRVVLGVAVSLFLIAGVVHAQQPPAKSSTQSALKREEAGGVDAQNARARAKGGDCAGALPLFDAAIEVTVEPTLRRDRGLCHEKLNHPFPAIEDYRAYLATASDAPDAEQIRQRLAALDSSSKADPATGGGGGAGAGGATSNNAREQRDFDYQLEQEQLSDAAKKSPLREGKGFVLGAFLNMPRFFVGEAASKKLAYGVGATLRYSTGPTLSIIADLGFAGIGVSGEATSSSGPILMGGAELRLPISRYAGDHILLRGGLGYERYVVSGTRGYTDDLLGRFAVGLRHVFGSSVALEGLIDGGPVIVFPENGDTRINGVIGGSFAFVVGF